MRLIARGGGICVGCRSAPIGHLRALVPRAAWSDRNPGCALAFFILRWDTAKRQQRPTIARNEGESSLSIRSGGPSIRPLPFSSYSHNFQSTWSLCALGLEEWGFPLDWRVGAPGV